MRRTTVITRALCVTLALALTVLAAGCASGYASPSSPSAGTSMGGYTTNTSDKASYDMAPEQAAIQEDGGEGFSGSERPAAEQSQTGGAGSSLNRKIIKTVNMYMETLEFDTLLSSLTAKTNEFGGYVENSSISGLGVNQKINEEYAPTRNAYITVRVPTEKLEEFTNLIGTLGNVTQKDENSEDITLTYADTEARKDALTVEYERLMALLEKAESLEAVVALEARLSEVRYELDSLGSSLRRYDSLVDYSTVRVSVQEVRRLTPTQTTPDTIGKRITTGFKETLLDIRDGAGNFAVWFVVNLPYLLIWAAIITGIVFAIRRLVKKQKAKRAAQPAYYPPAANVSYPTPPVANPEQKDEK